MITYVLRRILGTLPTLFVLATLTFFVLRLAPGGPFDSERAWPPAVKAAIEARYGLDQPLFTQYLDWMGSALQGDLKESFQYLGVPTTQIIFDALPASAWIGTLSLAFALLLGIPLGCLAAWKRGTIWDSSAMFLAIAGVSLPSYLVATVLILIFALWLGWLPAALWEEPSSAVLPVITLGSRPMAIIARLVRSSMLDVIHADFIRTAYAKGLSTRRVIFKHALKNSLIPVITILGPLTANLITGSFLIEVMFQVPGIGKHFVAAVINRDYPLVMAVTLVYGFILILSNLAVDLAYALVDPRIRLSHGARE